MKNISVFNKKTVYNGTSVAEFNYVREILEKNNISYKYQTTDLKHNSWLGDKGVTRSIGGNFRDASQSLIYEICVHKDDYEQAVAFIQDKIK